MPGRKLVPGNAHECPVHRGVDEGLSPQTANLSLKLHLENSYSAFERVVRCGGLLSALDPSIASKHLDKESQQWVLQCQGFNDKNHYDRTTPCDHDTLRKAVKDVQAQRWIDWFNGPVQEVFQSHGFFDPAGIFIGDGSYLFVPDNPAYELSRKADQRQLRVGVLVVDHHELGVSTELSLQKSWRLAGQFLLLQLPELPLP